MKMIIYLLTVIISIAACDKGSDPDLPLMDIDGNQYDTVKIGPQFWMQQNLMTSHYRNGDPIPEITSNTLWLSLTSGAWCWYNNDSVTYAATYGKLYNWFAVNDPRGLAPEGWHVPSDLELKALSMSLGGDLVAGGEMKERGTTHWTPPNTDATNNSGMTCLPGGFRFDGGTFKDIGKAGYWWSSIGSLEENANYWTLYYLNARIVSGADHIQGGFSVRCLRD